MFFEIECFLTVASYQFFKKSYWIFLIYGFFFQEKILYNSTISNFESKDFSGRNCIQLFKKKHFLNKITIFDDYLLIFKIGNSSVVENIILLRRILRMIFFSQIET